MSSEIAKPSLYYGLIRIRLTAKGNTETTDSCATTSTTENTDLFKESANNVAETIRNKYPHARTIQFDSASDMTKSKSFANELPGALTASGFESVSSPPADVVLRIDLMPDRVPIEESVVKYEITMMVKDSSFPFRQKGTGTLSAKLAGSAPEACPKNFADLDWLSANDPLFQVARQLAKDVRKQNSASSNK